MHPPADCLVVYESASKIFICRHVDQVGVSQAGVQGWTEKHLQHADGQSFAGVSQFR